MSANPRWHYIQSRLQARHGERLHEADWRNLDAAQTIERYIEQTRLTPLRRFTDCIHGAMNSHAIEHGLRSVWRDYVMEISVWLSPAWQPAVLWTACFPDLPAIDALLKGAQPHWASEDPNLAIFTGVASRPTGRSKNSAKIALASTNGDEKNLAAQWYAHWRLLWPRCANADSRSMHKLAHIIVKHFEQLDRALSSESSNPYRRELSRKLAQLFRQNSASPTAVFSHLALVALDLERLRGSLARRSLFHGAREAA